MNMKKVGDEQEDIELGGPLVSAVDVAGRTFDKEARNLELRKRAASAVEDKLAALRTLDADATTLDGYIPAFRALSYLSEKDSTTEAKERVFSVIYGDSLAHASKLVGMLSRGLELTEREKARAVGVILPMAAENAAFSRLEAKKSGSQADLLDESLRAIWESREAIENLSKDLVFSESDSEFATVPQDCVFVPKDDAVLRMKSAISTALLPIADYVSQRGGDVAESVEAYKAYLVNDALRFFEQVSSSKVKIPESTKLDLFDQRARNVGLVLLSELKGAEVDADAPITRESLVKNRIPSARGLIYQVDSMIGAAVSGLKTEIPFLKRESTVPAAVFNAIKHSREKRVENNSLHRDDSQFLIDSLRGIQLIGPFLRGQMFSVSRSEGSDSSSFDFDLTEAITSLASLSKKLTTQNARTLGVSKASKRAAVSRSAAALVDLVALRLTTRVDSDSLDNLLPLVKLKRAATESLYEKLKNEPGDELIISEPGLLETKLESSYAGGLFPIAAAIASMSRDEEPKYVSDILEMYKNYFVSDALRTIKSISTDELKVSSHAQIEYVGRRVFAISKLLVSDLYSQYVAAGKLPPREEISEERIPVVRGNIFQADSFLISVDRDLTASRPNNDDLPLFLSEMQYVDTKKDQRISAVPSKINKIQTEKPSALGM